MTGREHYREAEILLTKASQYDAGDEIGRDYAHTLAAEAHAHAVLALVAVTAPEAVS